MSIKIKDTPFQAQNTPTILISFDKTVKFAMRALLRFTIIVLSTRPRAQIRTPNTLNATRLPPIPCTRSTHLLQIY